MIDEGFEPLVQGQPPLLVGFFLVELLPAIPDRGGVSRPQPGAAARELAELAFDDLDLVAQHVDLGLLFFHQLLGKPLQVGEIDGFLAKLQLLLELCGLVLQCLEMPGEINCLAISQIHGRLDFLRFLGLGVEEGDLLIARVDLGRDPPLRVLTLEEDVQEGQDRAHLGEIEEGHHGRASDGQREAEAVRPGKSYQPYKVLHE